MNPALGLLLLLLHLHVVVLDVAGHWRCYKTVLVVVCWWWGHRHLMKVRRRLEVLLIHGGRTGQHQRHGTLRLLTYTRLDSTGTADVANHQPRTLKA